LFFRPYRLKPSLFSKHMLSSSFINTNCLLLIYLLALKGGPTVLGFFIREWKKYTTTTGKKLLGAL
jgi:hypothetical protein